jgi:hypothetical protein
LPFGGCLVGDCTTKYSSQPPDRLVGLRLLTQVLHDEALDSFEPSDQKRHNCSKLDKLLLMHLDDVDCTL